MSFFDTAEEFTDYLHDSLDSAIGSGPTDLAAKDEAQNDPALAAIAHGKNQQAAADMKSAVAGAEAQTIAEQTKQVTDVGQKIKSGLLDPIEKQLQKAELGLEGVFGSVWKYMKWVLLALFVLVFVVAMAFILTDIAPVIRAIFGGKKK